MTTRFIALLGLLAFGINACAGKQPVKDQAPQAAVPAPQATAQPTAQATAVVGESEKPAESTAHVLVRKGDSLWSIAARPAVLGDPLRRPLLFKQNRDQIEDPDLIEVSQDLSYGKPVSAAEISEAIRLAEDTPPYVRHSEARRPLPLKY